MRYGVDDARGYIAEVRWQFAKTMPQWPHEYTVREWRRDLEEDFFAFVALIRRDGIVKPWPPEAVVSRYRHTYLALDGWEYWTMSGPISETTLINRALLPPPRVHEHATGAAVTYGESGSDSSFAITEGSAESPCVLHVPHSARRIPAWVRERIVLEDDELAVELASMTDAHTLLMAEQAAAAVVQTPWLFANRLSRLVVDPERFPDEREEMLSVGMGPVYTRTSDGKALRAAEPGHAQALLEVFFEPYAAALADLVAQRLVRTGRAVLLDIHSYPTDPLPYELRQTASRPEICLGTDERHTPAWLLDLARAAFAPVGTVGVNEPFAGTYVPLRFYGTEPRVASVMVEIRRDVYLSSDGGPLPDAVFSLSLALASIADQAAQVVSALDQC